MVCSGTGHGAAEYGPVQKRGHYHTPAPAARALTHKHGWGAHRRAPLSQGAQSGRGLCVPTCEAREDLRWVSGHRSLPAGPASAAVCAAPDNSGARSAAASELVRSGSARSIPLVPRLCPTQEDGSARSPSGSPAHAHGLSHTATHTREYGKIRKALNDQQNERWRRPVARTPKNNI